MILIQKNTLKSKIISLLLFCQCFVSCLTTPKKEDDELINTTTKENTEINKTSNNEVDFLSTKKFVFVSAKILKPELLGTKPTSEFEGFCYVKNIECIVTSDILEYNSFSEDDKYRLLDKTEIDLSKKYSYINQNIQSEAMVEYGMFNVKEIKNNKYEVKIINLKVLIFDSYTAASISKSSLKVSQDTIVGQLPK